MWFRDANASYNHPRQRILTNGDITLSEVPYFASIDSNLLYVGLRAGGSARVVTFNLAAGGVSSNTWHHLAATFNANTRVLTVYIDGVRRAQSTLDTGSKGTNVPLIVGRSGTGGDYWKGKLDDLRLWNVARTDAEIAANYRTELAGPVPGLVGNWHFDEGVGFTAGDSAGTAQSLSLLGGATWSTDTPPALIGSSAPAQIVASQAAAPVVDEKFLGAQLVAQSAEPATASYPDVVERVVWAAGRSPANEAPTAAPIPSRGWWELLADRTRSLLGAAPS